MNNFKERAGGVNRQIRIWQIGVIAYLFLVFLIYFGWFAYVQKSPLSVDNSVWGQAGDFIGGVLNPVVALAAFFWLTKGVQYQKEELADTRAALDAARVAQELQASNSGVALRLEALAALINSNASEISFTITEMQFLTSQLSPGKNYAISMLGNTLSFNSVKDTLADLSKFVKKLNDERQMYQQEIDEILKSTKKDLTQKR